MYLRKPNICSHQLDVQETVSHSSTESEIISLDAGVRMVDGLPALDSWNVVIEVLRSSKSTESPTHGAAENYLLATSQLQTQTKGKPRC